MIDTTTDAAIAAAQHEDEVLPPAPTTESMIIGEVLGSFMLSFLGLGIGVSATLWCAPNATWFSDTCDSGAGRSTRPGSRPTTRCMSGTGSTATFGLPSRAAFARSG